MGINSKLLLGACGLLLLGLILTIYFVATQWHADWQLAHQTLKSKPILAMNNQAQLLIEALPDKHLYGQALASDGEVPISNLQLLVTGIVKVMREQSSAVSKAYISIAGQTSKIYQVGDSLPYGVKVYEITPDTVIVENNGQFEKLPLPRETLQFKKITRESS